MIKYTFLILLFLTSLQAEWIEEDGYRRLNSTMTPDHLRYDQAKNIIVLANKNKIEFYDYDLGLLVFNKVINDSLYNNWENYESIKYVGLDMSNDNDHFVKRFHVLTSDSIHFVSQLFNLNGEFKNEYRTTFSKWPCNGGGRESYNFKQALFIESNNLMIHYGKDQVRCPGGGVGGNYYDYEGIYEIFNYQNNILLTNAEQGFIKSLKAFNKLFSFDRSRSWTGNYGTDSEYNRVRIIGDSIRLIDTSDFVSIYYYRNSLGAFEKPMISFQGYKQLYQMNIVTNEVDSIEIDNAQTYYINDSYIVKKKNHNSEYSSSLEYYDTILKRIVASDLQEVNGNLSKIIVQPNNNHLIIHKSPNLIFDLNPIINPIELKANFEVDNEINVNDTLQFTSINFRGVENHYWDFGDGSSSTLTHPKHFYKEQGEYDITLIVNRGNEYDTLVKERFVEVGPELISDFSVVYKNGYTPHRVKFNNDSEGNIQSYFWDFGDGGTSTEKNPEHFYYLAGIYDVTLTVSDGNYSKVKIKESIINVERRKSSLIEEHGEIYLQDSLHVINAFHMNDTTFIQVERLDKQNLVTYSYLLKYLKGDFIKQFTYGQRKGYSSHYFTLHRFSLQKNDPYKACTFYFKNSNYTIFQVVDYNSSLNIIGRKEFPVGIYNDEQHFGPSNKLYGFTEYKDAFYTFIKYGSGSHCVPIHQRVDFSNGNPVKYPAFIKYELNTQEVILKGKEYPYIISYNNELTSIVHFDPYNPRYWETHYKIDKPIDITSNDEYSRFYVLTKSQDQKVLDIELSDDVMLIVDSLFVSEMKVNSIKYINNNLILAGSKDSIPYIEGIDGLDQIFDDNSKGEILQLNLYDNKLFAVGRFFNINSKQALFYFTIDTNTLNIGISQEARDLGSKLLHPNPTSGTVSLNKFYSQVLIYTINGDLIQTFKNVNRIDLSSYQSGVYLIKLINKDVIKTKKIIKY